MSTMLRRRSFLIGLGAALAAPAIVQASALMPIKGVRLIVPQTALVLSGIETAHYAEYPLAIGATVELGDMVIRFGNGTIAPVSIDNLGVGEFAGVVVDASTRGRAEHAAFRSFQTIPLSDAKIKNYLRPHGWANVAI